MSPAVAGDGLFNPMLCIRRFLAHVLNNPVLFTSQRLIVLNFEPAACGSLQTVLAVVKTPEDSLPLSCLVFSYPKRT